MNLSRLTCGRIDHARDVEHGIVRRLQRRRVFAVKIFTDGDIFQFRSRN